MSDVRSQQIALKRFAVGRRPVFVCRSRRRPRRPIHHLLSDNGKDYGKDKEASVYPEWHLLKGLWHYSFDFRDVPLNDE